MTACVWCGTVLLGWESGTSGCPETPPLLAREARASSGSLAFQKQGAGSSRGQKNGTNKLQRPHLPSSPSREKAVQSSSPAFRTCPRLSNTSVVHKQASLAPAPSCTLIPLALCSASVSLFTRPGFFAFPAPTGVLFILAQARPCGCLWIMLVSLALCSSKEHGSAGRKSVP